MDGAFVMWDALLVNLTTLERTFLPTLVTRLLADLTIDVSVQQEKSTDSEAMCLWLVHLTTSEGFQETARAVNQDLQAAAMKACCLHPGYWTHQLGQRLVEKDAKLRSDWQDLFEASMLRPAGEIDVYAGADEGSTASSRDRLAGDAKIAGTGPVSQEHGGGIGAGFAGWRRAPMSPQVPIGVVA